MEGYRSDHVVATYGQQDDDIVVSIDDSEFSRENIMRTETSQPTALRGLAIMTVICILSGCAASCELREPTGTKIKVDTGTSAAILVESRAAGGAEQVNTVRAELASQLLAKGAFASIQTDSEAADTLLHAKITRFSGVSGTARVMFGALAGQAEIEIEVTVIDRKTKEKLGKVSAVGKSSGGHIFAGTTPEAIERAVTLIVDYLLRNRSAALRREHAVG